MPLTCRTSPAVTQYLFPLTRAGTAHVCEGAARALSIGVACGQAVARPALACALLLLLSPGPSPSQAEFSPPRVTSKIGDGTNAPEQLRYYMDRGLDSGIERGDVLNVYREKRVSRNSRRPLRLLIGRMTITDSQPGISEGIFAVSDATVHHPLIRHRSAMKGDMVVPRIVIDSTLMFDAGKSSLTREAANEFEKVANFVLNFSPAKIVIEGHTDADGDPESNMILSEARAKVVRNFLITTYDFISPDMVDTRGYGADRPIVPNDTPENKQLNRRIEVIVWN